MSTKSRARGDSCVPVWDWICCWTSSDSTDTCEAVSTSRRAPAEPPSDPGPAKRPSGQQHWSRPHSKAREIQTKRRIEEYCGLGGLPRDWGERRQRRGAARRRAYSGVSSMLVARVTGDCPRFVTTLTSLSDPDSHHSSRSWKYWKLCQAWQDSLQTVCHWWRHSWWIHWTSLLYCFLSRCPGHCARHFPRQIRLQTLLHCFEHGWCEKNCWGDRSQASWAPSSSACCCAACCRAGPGPGRRSPARWRPRRGDWGPRRGAHAQSGSCRAAPAPGAAAGARARGKLAGTRRCQTPRSRHWSPCQQFPWSWELPPSWGRFGACCGEQTQSHCTCRSSEHREPNVMISMKIIDSIITSIPRALCHWVLGPGGDKDCPSISSWSRDYRRKESLCDPTMNYFT